MAKTAARVRLNTKPRKQRLTFKVARKAPARQGTKLARMVELLSRPDGASLGELVYATGWRDHSVRSALSAGIKNTLGLQLSSVKLFNTKRRYYAKAPEASQQPRRGG